ncbi:D-aminoacyl-tRNA deacylase [Alkalilimnicola ehrlichii MLHE-1]|uniref:D-aminoacyl-tRNA deacylase n=1 Tax=Alkalilimnicola ehrlichii (strain ATCC BAA-1101 / DSM 17681 / MLHE-1) TaxID=187272 RepID=DTD_ALKEH|nr:D-aminoacyl-tRNA deacylase [Alkalilimnicola ehrlichii]Q0A5C9.1 RecName: Full=D-aminoacyl-tRNA deacylase; Short=DTD; AltName: Full=Gly-tRNA(Ala) deacylase [Alkalilimnicola ehrlichii MLHE-1]ABI57958.1 D-tyrosyl-tRNA(Tyr) deacylase [Alkalilimnicola ehrlichii MLHE-1]
MIGLIQRVREARVEVDGVVVGRTGRGLLALIGVQRDDDEPQARRLLERILGYRVFPDEAGRMNRSVRDIGGGLLLVPQFTLAADTRKGMRASFAPAASPERGEALFHRLLGLARESGVPVEAGRFAADMQVHLINDGPVTFWLEARPSAA